MSQITIGGTTLNFKDSAFTGDQWEQVASWVLNGGAEGIDANAQIATEKAAAASASAAAARNSATSAGESATAAANSATAAKASEDSSAGSAANAGKSASSAANSAASASSSATAAANSAVSAVESIKHAPRINSDGKWELWDATTNAYVATEYTAIGRDGAPGANGTTPHIGENGNWYIGSTDTGKPSRGATGAKGDPGAAGAKGDPGEPGAAGKDGTTPHIGENGNWYIGDTDTGVLAGGSDLPTVTDADAGKYLHVNSSTKELEWAEAGDDTPLTKDSVVTALGYTPLNPSVDSVTLAVNGTRGLSLTSAYSMGLDITADMARMNMTPVTRGAVASPSPAVKLKGDASSDASWSTDKDVILTGIADGTEDNDAATVRQLKGYVASESPGWAGGDMLMMRDGEGFITYAEMAPGTVGAMPNVPVNDAAKGKYLHVNASTKELEWAEAGEGTTPHIGENGNWYIGDTDTGKPSRGATGATGAPGADYVLTSADKAEIAAMVLAEIPNGDEVTYG